MARNLLSETTITHAFAHFPETGFNTIHPTELRPIFESLPADQQEWAREIVLKYDPRDGQSVQPLSRELGVTESVAIGLAVLLHPEA